MTWCRSGVPPLLRHWSYASCALTHWGRVTHIYVSKLTVTGSDNGLSPDRRQAIISTNVGILLTEPLGTNFSEILIEIPLWRHSNVCAYFLWCTVHTGDVTLDLFHSVAEGLWGALPPLGKVLELRTLAMIAGVNIDGWPEEWPTSLISI